MLDMMRPLRIYHVRLTIEAVEVITFGAQPGAQLRGALYGVLSQQFCSETGSVHTPGHHSRCPACWLLATEDPDNVRGRDLPRPLILEPPLGADTVGAGERLTFGALLVGDRAKALFPFLVRAVEEAGQIGVGRGRGRFILRGIQAVNHFTQTKLSLLQGDALTDHPGAPITTEHILQVASALPADCVTLHFLTPLRIGENKRLAHRPELGILLRRLTRRCQTMIEQYGDTSSEVNRAAWKKTEQMLGTLGDTARLIHDDTRWLDIESGSRRRGVTSPIGGLVGRATWQGALGPVLPWLLWGEVLRVGKSTVKGNGWYRVERN